MHCIPDVNGARYDGNFRAVLSLPLLDKLRVFVIRHFHKVTSAGDNALSCLRRDNNLLVARAIVGGNNTDAILQASCRELLKETSLVGTHRQCYNEVRLGSLNFLQGRRIV